MSHDPAPVSPARQEEAGDIDVSLGLANFIRAIDGNHTMSAAELAERIVAAGYVRVPPSVSGGLPEPNWKALGRSAVEAAQTVIGQCDCTMSEDAAKDPKSIWRKARDAYWRAAAPEAERREPEP